MKDQPKVQPTEQLRAFGIRLQRKDGTYFLATSAAEAGPRLFWQRADAEKYRTELVDGGMPEATIVSVVAAFVFPLPKKKARAART